MSTSVDVLTKLDYQDLSVIKNKNKQQDKKIKFINHFYSLELHNNKHWELQEIDYTKQALDKQPDSFYKVPKDKLDIYREVKSPDNTASTFICATTTSEALVAKQPDYEPKKMTVYNAANNCLNDRKLPKILLDSNGNPNTNHYRLDEISYKFTFIHESAHVFTNNGNENIVKDFENISWETGEQKVTKITYNKSGKELKKETILARVYKKGTTDNDFVSDYAGGINEKSKNKTTIKYSNYIGKPKEDFAESVAFYVYFPDKLKQISKEKYDFIKNRVYNGKEFKGILNE